MKTPWPLSDPIGVPLLGLSCRSHSRTVSRPHAVFLMSWSYSPSQAHPWRAGLCGIRWSQFVRSMGPSSAANSIEYAQPAGIQEASWPPVGTASEPGMLTPSPVTCPDAEWELQSPVRCPCCQPLLALVVASALMGLHRWVLPFPDHHPNPKVPRGKCLLKALKCRRPCPGQRCARE